LAKNSHLIAAYAAILLMSSSAQTPRNGMLSTRVVSGDRAVVRWVYHEIRNGQPWHIRGVDVFTVRDEKVAAELAYVKG
jgi:ketosteroid isomerase-like protein